MSSEPVGTQSKVSNFEDDNASKISGFTSLKVSLCVSFHKLKLFNNVKMSVGWKKTYAQKYFKVYIFLINISFVRNVYLL